MMKKSKAIIPSTIIPILIAAWGIVSLLFSDPFYSRSSDPEYPYLVNGLNCALLNFDCIGHTDHPGTPFQLFNGLVIRVTHLLSGKGDIVSDVFSRPEHYLNAISVAMLLVQVVLAFAIGMIAIKRKIPFWQASILQASCFFNDVLLDLFGRVNPDHFFEIIVPLFILVYLLYGYEGHSMRKFSVWSGIVMALGFATKFNFLPLVFLPLVIINNKKDRLVYMSTGIVSFFVLILPIVDKLGGFSHFIFSIFKHDGLYGEGEANAFNIHRITQNIGLIFKINPLLPVLFIVLCLFFLMSFRKKNETATKKFMWVFVGLLLLIVLQIGMVSKHFKNYYMAPMFLMYGFMFFTISLFLSTFIQKKWKLALGSSILPVLFMLLTAGKAKEVIPIVMKQKALRNEARKFVGENITKNDYWFVEPTWESAPYAENAVVYGLSYCRHREAYVSQLKAINSNIITFEGDYMPVKLWRGTEVLLDSVIASGKNIYLYSTPGRNVKSLLSMINDAAVRNNLLLSKTVVYSNKDLGCEIIKVKSEGLADGQSLVGFPDEEAIRQQKIKGYIHAINSSPDWLADVKKKAEMKNISLDSMVLLDAIWMVEHEK